MGNSFTAGKVTVGPAWVKTVSHVGSDGVAVVKTATPIPPGPLDDRSVDAAPQRKVAAADVKAFNKAHAQPS